jgi:hypothetical protein
MSYQENGISEEHLDVSEQGYFSLPRNPEHFWGNEQLPGTLTPYVSVVADSLSCFGPADFS